jgi:hypothetical protein
MDTPNIFAAAVTLLVNAGTGGFVFVLLLVALNGYSESDAAYGLGVYFFLAAVLTLVASALAWVFTIRLRRRGRGAFLSVFAAAVVGAVSIVFAAIAGVLVAEIVRTQL